LQFGLFELDLALHELRKRGLLIRIENLPFQILEALIERPGDVVTREELRGRLWPDGTHVEFEDGLNTAVRKLRHALSDSAESPIFIETLPRRGYRFIAPVSAVQLKELDQVHATPAAWGQQNDVSLQAIEPIQPTQRRRWGTSARYSGALAAITVLCLLLLWGGRAFHTMRGRRSELPNPQALNIQKLTESGDVDSAAISPDGRFVVYSRQAGEEWSLRIRQTETGGSAGILSPEPQALIALTFSPDGNYLYFGRADKDAPGYHRLYVMPALGGPAQLVMNDVDSPPSFSPDGLQFVFTRGVTEKNLIELRIARSDGTGERLLASIPESSVDVQHGATWSPDGRTVAVGIKHQGKRFDSALYAVAVTDGNLRRVFAGDGGVGRPLWLPDGHTLLTSIANTSERRGQLWFVPLLGGDPTRLTNDLSDYDLTLDLTPDGKKAVLVQKTIDSKIWVSSGGLMASMSPVTNLTGPVLEAVETTQGTIVARGLTELWSVDAKNQIRSLFAKLSVDDITSCGRYVVVNTVQDGTRQLIRFDADGTHPTTLVNDNLWFPTCSSNGRFVFYSTQNDPLKVMRVSVEGGAPREIVSVPGGSVQGPLDVSPDNRLVVFACGLGAPITQFRFCIVKAEGGPLLRAVQPAAEANLSASLPMRQIRWSPDGSAIQYIAFHDGTTNVWEQPVSGGPVKQLTEFTTGQIFSFHWSRDGKRLLVGQGNVTSDIVLLSNFR
jgi:eukaryotic-like serine/threonine-protein kinase